MAGARRQRDVGGREGAAVLAWLPAGWSSGGAGLWPSWDELGGLGVALCFIFIVSPPSLLSL